MVQQGAAADPTNREPLQVLTPVHQNQQDQNISFTALVLQMDLVGSDHRAAGGHVLTRITSSLLLDKSNLYDDHFLLPV